MDVHRLDERQAAELRAAPYTYEDVGGTATGAVAGFTWIERTAVLKRQDFEGAVDDLLSWQVQARSGMQVWASALPLEPGSVVVLRLGPGRLSLRIPCRVVYVVDEPDLKGSPTGPCPGTRWWARSGSPCAASATAGRSSRSRPSRDLRRDWRSSVDRPPGRCRTP